MKPYKYNLGDWLYLLSIILWGFIRDVVYRKLVLFHCCERINLGLLNHLPLKGHLGCSQPGCYK